MAHIFVLLARHELCASLNVLERHVVEDIVPFGRISRNSDCWHLIHIISPIDTVGMLNLAIRITRFVSELLVVPLNVLLSHLTLLDVRRRVKAVPVHLHPQTGHEIRLLHHWLSRLLISQQSVDRQVIILA